MTATEIVEASKHKTWKENSIYILMNALIKKKAVVYAHSKPTITNTAKTYIPAITSEEYAVLCLRGRIELGVRFNIPTLIEHLMDLE